MNAIAAIFANYDQRPTSGGYTLPGEVKKAPLETQGIAGGGAVGVEEMLLELEKKSFYTEVALRVQVGDMAKQPLSRVETTDLALMIASGKAMTQALAAVAADRAPISTTLPSANRQR